MGIDSRSEKRVPATADEQIVASVILGACTHRDWSEFKDKHLGRMLVCSDCNSEFEYSERLPDWSLRDRQVSPGDYLLCFVPHSAQDELLAALVVRRIEAAGWTAMMRTGPSGFTQSFSRNGIRFASSSSRTQAAAICEAAAQLARSGQLKVDLVTKPTR